MYVFGRVGKTHAYTGRTYKLQTERPQLGFKPGTLLLWGGGVNHNTTVKLPIWPDQLKYGDI